VSAQLDHLVVAAATLDEGVAWCEATLGVTPGPGGRHALMGTHNRLLKLDSAAFPHSYLEIIAIDPAAPPPGRPRWFGLDDPALRAAVQVSPRLHHVVLRTPDIEALRQGLGSIGYAQVQIRRFLDRLAVLHQTALKGLPAQAADAAAIAARAEAEIARLEAIFSLYRPGSALLRLNARGHLDAPPFELLECLSIAGTIHRATGGRFDPSVQRLWEAHAKAAAVGRALSDAERARALSVTGWDGVTITADRVTLRPGVALTLNGIAQGYIADEVVELLRAEGVAHTLVDLVETRALGRHSPARRGVSCWRIRRRRTADRRRSTSWTGRWQPRATTASFSIRQAASPIFSIPGRRAALGATGWSASWRRTRRWPARCPLPSR